MSAICLSPQGYLHGLGIHALFQEPDTLRQWFLTLLEVLNPTSSICAFTKPFLIGKIKHDFFQIQNIGITMHKMNHASTSLCSKNKIIKTWFSQKKKHNNEYLLQISVTSAVAFQRTVQKCTASPWKVPLSCHFPNKVCSFSSFLCPIQFNSIQFIYIAPNYNNCHLKAL